MIELLSPAASTEAVIAAVQSGANSVYIRFGGDAGENFSEDDFYKALRYCRLRGCRVYVHFDTVLRDEELDPALALIKRAAQAGISAVVVEDLGLAAVLRAVAPELPLHAGLRLGFRNLADCETAAQLGFSRVRLPVEISLSEIRFLAQHSRVELELLAQGGTCVSYRGLCRLSAFSGGGSASRGKCGEVCRGRFSLGGRMDDEHPLSMKLTCLISHLAELEQAGISCIRLEDEGGRAERTALLCRIYSAAIREGRGPLRTELDDMYLAYSHRAFTDGYLTEKTEDMFGVETDRDPDQRRLFSEIRRGYAESEARRVPLTFYAVAQVGRPLLLAVEDGDGNRAAFRGRRISATEGRPLTRAELETELYKTGSTQYYCNETKIMVDSPAFTGDDIEAVRARLLREIGEKRAAEKRLYFRDMPAPPVGQPTEGKLRNIFQVLSAEQLIPELAELAPDYIYVPLEIMASEFDRLRPFTEAGATPVAVLPQMVSDGQTPEVLELLRRVRGFGVGQALVRSLGQIAMGRRAGLDLRGDLTPEINNSYAAAVAKGAGLLSFTAPCEQSADYISRLCKPIDMEMIVYGRLPLMVTEQCLIKRSSGRCSCASPANLADNRGAVYPVAREYGCRNTVYNSLKLYVPGERVSGLWARRLSFTTESARECVEVAKGLLGHSSYRPNGLTRGLYYKGSN